MKRRERVLIATIVSRASSGVFVASSQAHRWLVDVARRWFAQFRCQRDKWYVFNSKNYATYNIKSPNFRFFTFAHYSRPCKSSSAETTQLIQKLNGFYLNDSFLQLTSRVLWRKKDLLAAKYTSEQSIRAKVRSVVENDHCLLHVLYFTRLMDFN